MEGNAAECVENTFDKYEQSFSMFSEMLHGEYTYLTYALMSASCFGLWLVPAFGKANNLLFPNKGKKVKRAYNRKKPRGETPTTK
jgi:hypothetical protein